MICQTIFYTSVCRKEAARQPFLSSIGLRKIPIPSISISQTTPCRIQEGALRVWAEAAGLVEAGGCHDPERHVNPVIFQQRRDDAKLVLQRLHPIRNVVHAAHP